MRMHWLLLLWGTLLLTLRDTSNNTQEEVEPPNIDEIDDDARHEKETVLPTQREKRRIIPQRRYIEE